MESEISKVDRENLVNLNRKVFELEKEIEFYHISENALRDALKECQIQNEKLQINNGSLHTQLNCESRNCAKANENCLKAEALVKHLEEKEEYHEELKRQLVNLNQEKEKSILKQIQLTNNINDVTIQLEYSRQEIGQQKLREKHIQEQNQRLENHKIELQKQNESITDELLSLKEKLNQQADEIKQKQDEVESLKEIIDLKNTENSKSSKKVVSPN
ncbi:uncharacterized protein DC041_0008487 [Schistosoma bovis]|uniref:Uncharacterized protein n=1 Tax=Schistosoma bovis TaxID=6184 RepID=A0A430QAD2_SCHBO|nr:uncharacterized protein DC041_0008487 [Schistosoma bovis]